MVIAFQNLFSQQYEGGANWLEVTLLSLGLLATPPTCLVIGASADALPISLRDLPHVKALPLLPVQQSTGARLLKAAFRRVLSQPWENPAIAEIISSWGVDLWISFCGGYEGLGPERKLLVWYPDFQFRYFPEFFDPQEVQDREHGWDYVCQRADGIIAISESVAADALKAHSQMQAKVHVCAFAPVFPEAALRLNPQKVREQYHLPSRFFLVCNQFWTHKNHALVLQALQTLKEQGATPPVIAFTGRTHDYRNPDAFSELLQYVHAHDLHPYCRFLGVVPRAEQIALIRAAAAVVHPSRFEGRGAIVEESYVLGTQVLCSDLPVHRELDAPGTLFFSVDGVNELAELLQREYPASKKRSATIAAESKRLALDYGTQFMEVCNAVAGASPV